MKIRARTADGITTVRLLITHPMETGRRRDETSGMVVPAHYIEELTLEHDGKPVVRCRLTTAVSKDPYFSFQFRGGRPGERIRVNWTDNLGNTESQEGVIE
ncbi:thiosulfate oxidation carrier complex protein SoxZ [Methylococcus capsulatus]|uniref:thiosulfate oxidation carrier complex protein SoxZ n=1 Tax=Methylococcus capsulatus TaxID=414 RepID=UPI001C533E25|nr:thiosulfate oxidation carrier complex protein SoxZ [Methylococcus capsulatus]QXP87388.1 thiosulfate oxidation carrier complex protein SoxZ [Methylococcus capsulatus]QXP92871.1 thiosulfate oxidation carrier complex protein SoxZ [Methylococcus capsulatus]UQN12390.1 thiosulfate oxidation carrier complex protein SoxZ [Methylococcus capsulatus]